MRHPSHDPLSSPAQLSWRMASAGAASGRAVATAALLLVGQAVAWAQSETTGASTPSAVTGISMSQFDQILITATLSDHNTVVIAPNAGGDALNITLNGATVSYPMSPFLSL